MFLFFIKLYSFISGIAAGSDDAGNVYYIHKNKKKSNKRWIVPNDLTKISPDWYLWLHGSDIRPSNGNIVVFNPSDSIHSYDSAKSVTNGVYSTWVPRGVL